MRFSADHKEARGVGYTDGYSSLNAFLCLPLHPSVHPFVELRAHLFNNDRAAGNVGAGLRLHSPSVPCIFGVNAFYDYRDAQHASYHRVGIGAELIGPSWDIRANGYLPIQRQRTLYNIDFFGFQGNFLLLGDHYEVPLEKGYDVSFGKMAYRKGVVNVHMSAGGYYLAGAFDKRTTGAMAKLRSCISPYLSLEVDGFYDHLFKTTIQGKLTLSVPVGPKERPSKTSSLACSTGTLLSQRLLESIPRFEIIPTTDHLKPTPAIDPLTNDPYFVVYVNNQSSLSEGTFEHPYSQLLSAQQNSSPYDIIYVFAGDGTPFGMDQGVTLQNNQRLQGSGQSFLLPTTSGLFAIPALTSLAPLIATTGQSTILLANNNIIKGLQINDGTLNGIFGNGVQNLLVENCSFLPNLSSAPEADIALLNSSGTTQIRNNLFASNAATQNILLENVTDEIAITQNNFVTSAPVSTELVASANVIFQFENNNLQSSNPSASLLSLDLGASSTYAIAVASNTLQRGSVGVEMLLTNSSASNVVLIENNTFLNQASVGVFVDAAGTGTIDLGIAANAVTGAGSGIDVFCTGTGLVNLIAAANQISATNEGMFLKASAGTLFATVLSNTSATTASPSYPFLFEQSGTGVFLLASPNGAISGVQALNIGPIFTSGTISFVPLP